MNILSYELSGDPEEMESINISEMNRSQFTHDYLKRSINDRYHQLTYSKRKPDVVCHQKYFDQIIKRYKSTNHIHSFEVFYKTFKKNESNKFS